MRMHGTQLQAYFKERFDVIRSANKFRYREFMAKYNPGRELPCLDDVERIMHTVRSQEMSLKKQEREESKLWLSRNSPDLQQ